MKTKLLCLILIISIVFTLSSCSKKEEYPLTIGDYHATEGVLAYYIDRIMAAPKDYGVNKDDSEAIIKKAVSVCRDIACAEKLMKDNSINLQIQYKSDIAEKTQDIWDLFGEYYKSIGVSKPDITKINTYEAMKKQLVQYYFGQNGKKPVSDDKLKQQFVEMFIGYKGFEGSFTKLNAKGETIPMTEKERENLIQEFREMANKINDGASIDDVYADYCSSQGLVVTEELQVNLVKENDPMYADDFFKKVSTISHGKAAPVTSGSSVYVVERSTIATSDEDAFEAYREVVLDEMKMPKIEAKITKEAAKLKVTEESKKINEIYRNVESVRSQKSERH